LYLQLLEVLRWYSSSVNQQEHTAMATPEPGDGHRQDPARGGAANPGKVGQAVGVHGINIVAVIAAYNPRSEAQLAHDQLREIARTKLPDLNAIDRETAERIVVGTARSMGIELVDTK
jgi:ribosomal protein L11